MDPEEYRQTVQGVWTAAAKLGGVLVAVVVAPVVLLAAVRGWLFVVHTLDSFGIRFASPLLPVPTVGGSGFVVELVRRDWVRRRLALAGASVTLALGVLAAALHLDERWQLRPGRFWCRSPRELDVRLGFWAGRRPEPTRSTGAAARGGKRTKRRKPKKG